MKIKEVLREATKKIVYKIEECSSTFITHIQRPFYSKDIGITSDELINYPKCSIVIQGPIITDKKFTLETIKIYKKLYPHTKIILSTWEDTPEKNLKEIKKEDIHIVLNKKPGYFGIGNINLQTISAITGIKKAKELGSKYAMKTRTDQRMYGINNIEFFHNLIESFPVKQGYKQKKRIITISLDTFKYRWYGASDMLNFGDIDDMLLYWSIKLEKKEYNEKKRKLDIQNQKKEFPICETKLSTNFLKKIGRTVEWNYEDSLNIYADHFCIVDIDNIDLYWYKYARLSERKFFPSYKEIPKKYELSFKEWFNLYSNINNKKINTLNKGVKKLQRESQN